MLVSQCSRDRSSICSLTAGMVSDIVRLLTIILRGQAWNRQASEHHTQYVRGRSVMGSSTGLTAKFSWRYRYKYGVLCTVQNRHVLVILTARSTNTVHSCFAKLKAAAGLHGYSMVIQWLSLVPAVQRSMQHCRELSCTAEGDWLGDGRSTSHSGP